jgi:hypothetical protein
MEADLSTLRMLAYDGRPLDITIRQDPEDRTFTLVERDGESRRSRSREADIINSLAHYPGPVRINGKETPATPFPDRAHFRITRQDQDWGRNRSETMEDPPGGKPRTRHNAYAAGVLCYIHLEGQQNMTYFSPCGPQGKSWQGAIKVELTPAYRLEQDELGLLEESRYGIPEAPAGSELHRELQKRAARQLEESAAHPKAPPRHEGPVHRYLLTQFNPAPFEQGMPIIASGALVVLDLGDDDNPARTVALAEAMYRYSEDLVPVQARGEETAGYPKITECEFEFTEQPGPRGPTWSMEPAADINVSFNVEGMGKYRIPADFDLAGYNFDDMHVRFVPGRAGEQELQHAIVRGYWDDSGCRDWDDVKYTIGEREREVRNMMEAAFRDPVQAFRNELERLVRSFNPNLPYPEVAVTVSSTDGRTIVEFDPAGKTR